MTKISFKYWFVLIITTIAFSSYISYGDVNFEINTKSSHSFNKKPGSCILVDYNTINYVFDDIDDEEKEENENEDKSFLQSTFLSNNDIRNTIRNGYLQANHSFQCRNPLYILFCSLKIPFII
jgi:hypothetical protein